MDTIPSWIKFSLPGIGFRVLSASGCQCTKDTYLEEARISALLPNAWGCGEREKKKPQLCRDAECKKIL